VRSCPYGLDSLNYLVPVCVHIIERFLAQSGKPEVPPRRSVAAGHGSACDEAVGLQACQNRVDIAFADLELPGSFECPDHLIAMTSAVPEEVEYNDIEEPFAQLRLPIIQIHSSPLFQG